MRNINPAKAAEGRAAYANGATVQNVFDFVTQAYNAADQAPRKVPHDPDEISPFQQAETDTKSYVVGFLDGALADLRRVSRGSIGLKA